MAHAAASPSAATVEGRFSIATIGVDRPWAWLAAGWSDLWEAPGVSLGYGLVFAVMGLLLTALLYLLDAFYMALPLAAGFMLVAPIIAVGLYEVSRRLALGEPVTMATPPEAWRRNFGQFAILGLVLMLFLLAWVRIATLIFALFFSNTPLELGPFIAAVFFSWQSVPFLLVGCGVGAVLAALVFAIAAISAPMLLDRDVSAITAIACSVTAVRRNWRPMALWAGLIALFTAAGLVVGYIGLALTLPLIGHASWHAYRDLVVEPGAV
jgi:uncharacterized membrane protein